MPFVESKRVEAQPFLKWAGRKAGLLRQLEEFFPHEVDRYIEPFLGGAPHSFILPIGFRIRHRYRLSEHSQIRDMMRVPRFTLSPRQDSQIA